MPALLLPDLPVDALHKLEDSARRRGTTVESEARDAVLRALNDLPPEQMAPHMMPEGLPTEALFNWQTVPCGEIVNIGRLPFNPAISVEEETPQ